MRASTVGLSLLAKKCVGENDGTCAGGARQGPIAGYVLQSAAPAGPIP